MELKKADSVVWHKLSRLDAIRQFLMCDDTRRKLDEWEVTYLDVCFDIRTGQFYLKQGSSKTRQYFEISR